MGKTTVMVGLLVVLLATATRAAEKELKHDDGRMESKASRAGTGHVIGFRAPKGSWWIRAVRIHGSRYGGGYDPGETCFRVTVCDDKLKALSITEAKYELFSVGRFAWIEVALEEPVRVPREFKLVVAFDPTRTRGVYVGSAKVERSHSALGLPGGRERGIERDRDWMIRALLTSRKPKTATAKTAPARRTSLYRRDFDYLARTVRTRFPALGKKGIDWSAVCKAWRPRFLVAADDKQHVLNAHRLLALLGDAHTGISDSTVEVHRPAFDGLFGAGLWIASEYGGGRLVLRAIMPGHALADRLRPGAELISIGGRPAKLVHRETRRRLAEWHGWSSNHFLDARLSFQFFPFLDRRTLSATFVDPEKGVVDVELQRWGPGGRGLSRLAVTLPDGLSPGRAALAHMLEDGIGYLRICGGMSEKTRAVFDEALDSLRGAAPQGILLDCRGMGGGGDGPAWAMAGRFFSSPTANGTAGRIKPTGAWQFDGPVVMLTDEREISSAETFTWAMVETGRVVSVGRPTGGATIIPRLFRAPSGLFSFRMGVHDRKTPIRQVQPEGIGTAPDLYVPYEPPLLRAHPDPVRETGRLVLLALIAGEEREAVLARLRQERLVSWDRALCEVESNPMPDFAAALHDGAPAGWAREAEAQRACEELLDREFPPTPGSLAALAGKYEGTRWLRALRQGG